MGRMIRLHSGRWYVRIEENAEGSEYLYLTHASRPGESMRVRLPFSWRALDDDGIVELARHPEVRIWCDEHDILWRVAAVGPGTPYTFPLTGRFLVFDSAQTWAGLVRYKDDIPLGELTDEALRGYRDSMSDLGGGRRHFRTPEESADSTPTPAS